MVMESKGGAEHMCCAAAATPELAQILCAMQHTHCSIGLAQKQTCHSRQLHGRASLGQLMLAKYRERKLILEP